ncbi:hypothetical protein ACQ4PT_067715 [Festuca glaucescens]
MQRELPGDRTCLLPDIPAPGRHINPRPSPPYLHTHSSATSSADPRLVHARHILALSSSAMAEPTAPRPLLRRVLSFREPLLVIPYLISFLATAASAFFHSYASFLQSFARSLAVVPSPAACAKCTYASSSSAPCCNSNVVDSNEEEEEEDEELRKEEVEAIMARIGLAASGGGEGLRASMGRAEVSRLFDAEEPSFAEVRRAFAVFDGDKDGLIGAADLQGALARLGFREDASSCEAMIAAASRGSGSGMNLFQFVTFLEDGLC